MIQLEAKYLESELGAYLLQLYKRDISKNETSIS